MNRWIVCSTMLFALLAGCTPARLGTVALTTPLRVPVVGGCTEPCESLTITTDDGLRLDGWLFPADAPRGLVVLVHGKDINRQHFVSAAGRFQAQGYAVLAYDQRAHGRSEGSTTTYGAREVPDLRRALDTALATPTLQAHPSVPVFLVGESLGAAVVLQAAAVEPRVKGVVAGASFADLRTIVGEKTPFFLSNDTRDESLELAARGGGYRVDDISPVAAARHITAPVLLLHGTADTYIPLRHSRRIYEALHGPKRFVHLDGVGHTDILLHEEAWSEIEHFINAVLTAPEQATAHR